ncbi:hypothetical protein [Micromonospora sp. NPDC126480]|uniref:tetratricopeptide repeat protein n=1 Tax=Micromonospora sp. NPDC126480 TaxID=3155312 RepID=UPI003321D13B
MSADEIRRKRRPRQVARVDLPAGPARELRDMVHDLYLRACPITLKEIADRIAADEDLPGAPGSDVIGDIIAGKKVAAKQEDVVSVAAALARLAGRDREVAVVTDRVRELWVAAKGTPPPPPPAPTPRLGKPISECDPVRGLEVHQAIDVPHHGAPLPPLPAYVPRAHDAQIRQVVDEVAAGGSLLVTLVGGSSTGKTRACWEAIQPLAEADRRWRVWHPKDPSRPDAAAKEIGEVGSFTVVWLNEAQHYLLVTANPALGEKIAAGLRTLLEDPDRGPVLVLATLWQEYWDILTSRPPAGQPDPYAQARVLLDGTEVRVPEAFTSDADLRDVARASGDPRLHQAIENAEANRVAQYLAGVPELLRRYRNAPPAARAVIEVAIDARRLGQLIAIPHALLAQAAPGYLTDHEWEQTGEDWLEQALAYTAKPCKGARGPVTRIKPRPGDPPPADGQPAYHLADYLDQIGRIERAGVFPPAGFWDAIAATIADPGTLETLATEVKRRGRYGRAASLYQVAADHGSTLALRALALLRERAGDPAGAEALAIQAADRGDTGALRILARLREQAGNPASADALLREAADRGDTPALRELALLREQAGDPAGAEALAIQAADRGDTGALRILARLREQAGNPAGADALLREAADRGDTLALRELALLRERAGDPASADTLLREAADRGDTLALRELALLRERAGDPASAVEALLREAADRGDTLALGALALQREQAGDPAGAEALAIQAADRGENGALRALALLREQAGDPPGAEALAIQAADRGDTGARQILARLRRAGRQPG